MIKIANSNIVGVSKGDSQFSKIYKGIDLVWKKFAEGIDNLMDVVLVNNETEKIFSTPNYELFDKDKYTPIGIVVIPGSHNVYGTGECGIMALNCGSCSNPEQGATLERIHWGNAYADTMEHLFTEVVHCGVLTDENAPYKDIQGVTSNAGILPTLRNGYSGPICPTDSQTFYIKYDITPGGGSCYAPSPYLENGSRNPQYYQTTPPSSPSNALSDFNGKKNTKIILEAATAQPDWRTNTEPTTIFATKDLKISWKSETQCEIIGKKDDIAIFKCSCADCMAENCQCGCQDEDCKTIIYTLENDGINTLSFEPTSENPIVVTAIESAQLPPIIDKADNGYLPAACCTWRYLTKGTKHGDWYLPAAGEASYVGCRWQPIIETLAKVKTQYGVQIFSENLANDFHTSNEVSSGNFLCVDYGYPGNIYATTKSTFHNVHPFTRMKLERYKSPEEDI